MRDGVAIFIIYIASHSLASDRQMNQNAIIFFPCVHSSKLLSITSEYNVFSIFLNAGDQLQSKPLERGEGSSVFTVDGIWLSGYYGQNKQKVLPVPEQHTSHLVSFL